MRNYNLSRTARANWPAGARALALWPLLVLACNVYDDTLVPNVSNPLGGGSGASSNGGTASNGGTGTVAGTSSVSGATNVGGGSGSTNAGTSSGGGAGEPTMQGGSAGDTGSSGSGSTASAGSTTTAGAGGEPPSEESVVVDDMEDGDTGIEVKDGRNGYWYAGNDGSAGTMEPSGAFSMTELAASDRSAFAAMLKASNFTVWGAVMGFNWVEQATVVKPYDASAYCGLRFWGKAAANTTVRLRVPDSDTHPSGGVCKDPGASGTACYDHFGKNLAFASAWKQFSVKFTELGQTGTGYHPSDGKLKASKLYALEWALPFGAGKTYQVWVDDVELIKCP